MTEREALKLALEALKQIDEAMPFPVAKLAIMEAEKALAQPEQEPVRREQKMFMEEQDLYTTPPQRTWVGLTDEEIDELHGSPMNLEHSGALKWVRIIEAKLKEKNT